MKRSGILSRSGGPPRTRATTVASRMSVGFAVAFGLVLILALVGLGWFYAISRDVGAFSNSATMAQTAADADIALRDLEVSVRDHLTYGDSQSLLDATLRRDSLADRLDSLTKIATDPADRAALDRASGTLVDYWGSVQRIIALRDDRSTRIITTLEPLVNQTREKLGLLKNAGGVDSTALASDAAIAVLLMQEHLSRFVERRDPQDAEAMRAQLAVARSKLTEMNRYLWVPGTRQIIGEVSDLLTKAADNLTRIEATVVEEDGIRAEFTAPNAAGIAANIGEVRRRADQGTDGLRSALTRGMGDYTKVAAAIAGVVLLVGLLSVWWIQRSVGRPVTAMADAVTALANGQTNIALPAIRRDDEVAALARAVQHLRATLESTERERQDTDTQISHLMRDKALAENLSEAKTDFLVNMGQQLHAPLTDIIQSSQTLMSELHRKGVTELAADVEHIQWTGEQLVGLVDSLLDYAKIEAGAMDVCLQDFDVNRLLVELRERSLPAADLHGNGLDIAAAPGLGTMHSDFTKVRQALLNLLDNACKFTQGGAILLSAEKLDAEGMWFRFTVSDNGRGFPSAQTGRLFQPFVQGGATPTSGKRRGAGLGLTLVGHYTAMLGGTIEVASEPGEGTRITLTLPAVYHPSTDHTPTRLDLDGPRPVLRIATYKPMAQLTS